MFIKPSSVKEKICARCPLEDTCGDLRGLCIWPFYVLIVSVIAGLAYFLVTMKL